VNGFNNFDIIIKYNLVKRRKKTLFYYFLISIKCGKTITTTKGSIFIDFYTKDQSESKSKTKQRYRHRQYNELLLFDFRCIFIVTVNYTKQKKNI